MWEGSATLGAAPVTCMVTVSVCVPASYEISAVPVGTRESWADAFSVAGAPLLLPPHPASAARPSPATAGATAVHVLPTAPPPTWLVASGDSTGRAGAAGR